MTKKITKRKPGRPRKYKPGENPNYKGRYSAGSRKPGRPRKRKSQPLFEQGIDPKALKGILIFLLFFCSGLILLSVFGLAGVLGFYLDKVLTLGIGYAKFILPVLFFGLGIAVYRTDKEEEGGLRRSVVIGELLLLIGASGISEILIRFVKGEVFVRGGGVFGYVIVSGMMGVMGVFATTILFSALVILGIVLSLNMTFAELGEKLSKVKEKMVQFREWFKSRFFTASEQMEKKISLKGMVGPKEIEKAGFTKKGLNENEYDRNIGLKGLAKKAEEISKPGSTVAKVPDASGWKPFPLKLLDDKRDVPKSGDIEGNAKSIKGTLKNFGIDVEMKEVNIGPTVTQYTLKPADGVKLSKITTLQNVLAMALAAHPLRIEAPIPGRSLVGVEVPNQHVAKVRLRELIESEEYDNRKSNLSLILGRNVAGEPVLADLAKMPHLLIAGATGSGKSVCINALLLSLLRQNSPELMRLILVDPKKVEMSGYNGIPHLLTPVITEAKKTVNAFKWLVGEMERRYKVLSDAGKRNLESYNRAKKEKMPFLVVVIDELADLMVVSANEVEAAIVRLAQMARAVGIHLILATQRPSVNVLTGLIKANIPTRIAFAVASQIDSRTIIDQAGAEKLLGNGDCLYTNSELGKPRRIQGSFLEEKEINKVNAFLRENANDIQYDESITEMQDGVVMNKGGGMTVTEPGEGQDELYSECKELVVSSGKASASYLQRRLKIGYARAARILDELEEHGVVGPANGAKPREILMKPTEGEMGPSGPSPMQQN